ncbi:MAG: gamma-butyrobetaine hydroxylase-like domain-containing protein [Litorivicinus sp.]
MSELTQIKMRRASNLLELEFADGLSSALSAEFLRTHSPSAEVQNHGGPMILVTGKADVGLVKMEPVGNYGVKIVFDDGHDSGIFSWQILRNYAENQDSLWQAYLQRLADEGGSRESGGVKLFAVKSDD